MRILFLVESVWLRCAPLIACLWCAGLLQGCSTEPQRTGPPNVILINADDLGFGDLSCYGATLVRTPNIDALAERGRRFTDAHAPSTVCSPSRYGLLTGRYPLRKNLWGPVHWRHPLVIEPDTPTLGTLFKSAGNEGGC